DVEAATVGASEMLSNQVKAYSLANSKVIMILDGDQSKVGEIFKKDFSALSKNDRVELVKQLAVLNVGLAGGEESLETWASWCKNHVVFIDQICAEQLLLMCLNPSHNLLKNVSQATNKQFKSAVRDEMRKKNLDTDPKSIAATFKTLLC
ncbi:hypothetical protein QE250_17050, partial [Chromatiaceae bacterium AAb-1]|nr:hypothetical protein [Chromatiaceae bacterium AAb-1]